MNDVAYEKKTLEMKSNTCTKKRKRKRNKHYVINWESHLTGSKNMKNDQESTVGRFSHFYLNHTYGYGKVTEGV